MLIKGFWTDRKARVQIWKTFLDIAIKDEKGSSGGALQTAVSNDSKKSKNNIDVEAFGPDQLEYLARRNLNGRQVSIKSPNMSFLSIHLGNLLIFKDDNEEKKANQ